jgi:acetyl esterase
MDGMVNRNSIILMKKIVFFILTALFICGINAQDAPTPEMVRNSIAKGVESLNIQPEDIFKIENRAVDSIPIRLYYASPEVKSIIYNIHGGAFVACDLETHENISRKIANATNALVIALDYKKPPEYPFPQSIDDVYTVYKWIRDNNEDLTGNTDPISIVSDSSGSLLAAALHVKLNDLKEKAQIFKTVYINPCFDLRDPGPYSLVVNWYLSNAEPDKPLASPLTSKDFAIFSPSFIIVNEKDILRTQGIEFAKKLESQGISNEVFTVMDEDHFGVFWAGAHPKIDEAFKKAVVFLKK